ncbi:type IV pilus secretin family protein [Pelobacter propionicus]|nr:type IV pilus secretin family protein [Pelobacter propionicus]
MMWMRRQSILLALSLAVVSGFSSLMPNSAESAQDMSQVTHKTLAAIESITVLGEGSAAELVIKLSAPTTYTSYRTTSPLRLVIDLSQSGQGAIMAPVVLNSGNFKAVTVSSYDTDAGVLTRLDVELVKDADAVLSVSKEKPTEIRVSFPSLSSPITETPVSAAVTDNSVVTGNSSPQPQETTAAIPEPVPSAQSATIRALTAVSVKNNAIVLAIDGGVGEFTAFRLSKPDRFAIDLHGVKSVLASRLFSVNAFGVSSVRLGLYPDKVRVVLDAVDGALPKVVAEKTNEGIRVAPMDTSSVSVATRGDGATASTANNGPAPASRADDMKPAATLSVPRVDMIDFQVVNGISRVAVKVVGNAVAEPPEKSPGFVTLTIKNTSLPKSLQRSLEAKGFWSPVLRVTPLLVTTRKGTDTKIRIAMRKTVPYEYRREGDMLFIDFKNPEGMIAEKPAVPYLVAKSGEEPPGSDAALRSELASSPDPSRKPLGSAKEYWGRKVTLEFADAEVRKIFQLLSEVSNKNFVLGDDVTGTISIKLVNVPWDQALDIILDAKDLETREIGNVLTIKKRGAFKEQLVKQTTYTEYFSVNYSDAKSIKPQLEALLDPVLLKEKLATITADDRTNTIIVTSVQSDIDRIRAHLVKMDIPEKQVMIEARIVEATSTFTRSLGVNWGVHYTDASGSLLGITQLDTGFGGITTAPPTSGTGDSAGGNMGISFGALGNGVQLDMRLSAAATAGLIKIISCPKVATLNNKKAKIAQGQQIPYTASDGDNVETKFVEAALSLEVTPHINANGTISMNIVAKNDSMGDAVGSSTAPAINTKEATTEMLLRDGETTVIGGIFVDTDNDSDAGVPFLMDIPAIGKFFKTNSKTKTKTELLVFITPRIMATTL